MKNSKKSTKQKLITNYNNKHLSASAVLKQVQKVAGFKEYAKENIEFDINFSDFIDCLFLKQKKAVKIPLHMFFRYVDIMKAQPENIRLFALESELVEHNAKIEANNLIAQSDDPIKAAQAIGRIAHLSTYKEELIAAISSHKTL